MAKGMQLRLREGRANWRDQLLVRSGGVLAYGVFAGFMWWLCRLQAVSPQVAGHPAMFMACFLAVVIFHIGSALALVGPELFRGASTAPAGPWLEERRWWA